MRHRALAAALALMLSSTLANAQERKSGVISSPPSAEKKTGSIGSAEAMANAAQQRSDAQQKAWDQKMKALTGTICTGC